MLHDLRYALRALRKRPSFAAGTILVLALAVGVNTAVFSLVNALLLRPLPVPAADRLAFVYHSDEARSISYAAYDELRELDVFDAMAARAADVGRLRSGADLIPLQGEAVTAGYFELLGVAPRMGRTLQAGDDSAGARPVVIISEALWRTQFAADANVLGRTMPIDAGGTFGGRYANTWRDYTIVGVMPASFTGTGNPWQPAQYWVPNVVRALDHRAASGAGWSLDFRPVVPIGAMKPNVTFAQARAAVDAAGREILQRSAEPVKAGATFHLLTARRVRLPFQGAYYMDVPRALATLGAIATLLLVIAGTNLGGMLLARGVSRRSEIAVRLSLGIARARLVRQLLAESLVIAAVAGGASLLLARLLVAAALRGFPAQIPGSNAAAVTIDVPIDGRVIVFAFGSGLVTAIVVGLAPAVQALRVDLLAALTASAPTATRSRTRLRRLVLIPQVALAVVLLLLSGVFTRSLLKVEWAPQGYTPDHVVILQTQFPQRQQPSAPYTPEVAARYRAEAADMRVAQDRILERVSAIGGVSSAALCETVSDDVPLARGTTSIISRSDYESKGQHRGVRLGLVSTGYFETLGIRLLRGRVFDNRDRRQPTLSVIVSERLANELWPGQDPIGQQLANHWADSQFPIRWMTVVGEVSSVTRPTEEYPWPVVYMPIESQPLMGTTFLVRGAGNPAELAAAAKQAIASVAPEVIVARARPLEATVSDARYPRRFTAGLVGASGLAALLLAAIGVFALMSYAVAQRLGEIGVRMVLGAGRRDIVRLIVRDGAAMAIAGIAIGFALAFAAIRYASHAFVPLPDVDAATFVAVPLILCAVVLAACYLPARRAARVDPLVVLRNT
jgi:putative ABC transport system permease protein